MTTAMATTDDTERGETVRQLAALAALMEAIDWRDVPTVSTYEVAAICAQIDEARAAVATDERGDPDAPLEGAQRR